jgi:hypothetical protein
MESIPLSSVEHLLHQGRLVDDAQLTHGIHDQSALPGAVLCGKKALRGQR